MAERDGGWNRRAWVEGPEVDRVEGDGWLGLSADGFLFPPGALSAPHGQDERLLEVVRSDRHFFIRQEAAKKIEDGHLLKGHAGDRHIGQLLGRVITRAEDIAHLAPR